MEGAYFSRTVEMPIHFHDRAAGDSIEARLAEVKLLEGSGGERAIILVAWIDYWTFERIGQRHCFGYTLQSIDRKATRSWQFSSSQPVKMELRLEGAARDSLGGHGGEALLDAAVAALTGGDATSLLLDVASYRYLTAFQERKVGEVSYLQGFKSIY